MQQTPTVDLANSSKDTGEQISAISAFVEATSKVQEYKKKLGNPLQKSVDQLATQLNKINKQQKRYLRSTNTSTDELLNLIGLTRGKSKILFLMSQSKR
jgi:hypothetical protein